MCVRKFEADVLDALIILRFGKHNKHLKLMFCPSTNISSNISIYQTTALHNHLTCSIDSAESRFFRLHLSFLPGLLLVALGSRYMLTKLASKVDDCSFQKNNSYPT